MCNVPQNEAGLASPLIPEGETERVEEHVTHTLGPTVCSRQQWGRLRVELAQLCEMQERLQILGWVLYWKEKML